MTKESIIILRERLALSEADFASLVGVDNRTVRRWEAAEATPSGSSEGVLMGLEDALRDMPGFGRLCRSVAPRGLHVLIYRLALVWEHAQEQADRLADGGAR